jgi:hypothetical protein
MTCPFNCETRKQKPSLFSIKNNGVFFPIENEKVVSPFFRCFFGVFVSASTWGRGVTTICTFFSGTLAVAVRTCIYVCEIGILI